jgi:23S rRNA U2552 (ribose-2'-O)-methylase RlmE/FtsJ
MVRRLLKRWQEATGGGRSPADSHAVAASAAWPGETGELYRLFLENGRGDLHKWHHYFPIYERYFSRLRGKKLALLEIGVARGGSLRLWRRYFGADAMITGIDVDAESVRHRGENIEIFIGDQADAGFLTSVAERRGPFDLVIDDGGHTARQQIVSFETLFPFVRDGGVYLVEDLHTNLWPAYLDHPLGVSFLDVATRMAEKLTWWHHDERSFARYGRKAEEREGTVAVPEIARKLSSIAFYDSVVVFEKAAVPEPRHEVR